MGQVPEANSDFDFIKYYLFKDRVRTRVGDLRRNNKADRKSKLTLTSVGDRRLMNESVRMIGSWVHRLCPRCQRRRHVHTALVRNHTSYCDKTESKKISPLRLSYSARTMEIKLK